VANVPVSPEKKDREGAYSFVPVGRNLPVLVASAFLLGGAFMLFRSLLQPLVLLLGGSITIVGVMVSISEFSMLLPMLIFGEYSDATGRRRPMLIASLILIMTGFLFMAATHWVVLILPVLVTGFAFALNQPATSAATVESVPGSRRGRAFAYRSAGRLMAGVIATILGVVVVRAGNIQNAFFLFTIFVGINLGLIYWLLTETLSSPRAASPSRLFRNIRNWKIPPKLKILYLYVVVTDTWCYGTGWSLIYGLLAEFQGVEPTTMLLYTMIMSLTGGLVQFGVAGRMIDRTRKWAIVLSDSIAVPAMLVCALFPGERIFPVVFLLMGFAMAFWGPAVQALVADHVPRDRIATEFGKLWGLRGLVSLFPPILGGILAETYGYSAPLLVNFGVGVISLSVVLFFLDRGKSP